MTQPLQQDLAGKYEILEKVGEGGLGAVYRVRHRLLNEIRVIKLLRSHAAAQEVLRQRFIHEARLAIRLKHRNIAQLHDFSLADDGSAFIVMEYIDGVTLDLLLDAAGPPAVGLAVEIALQGLAALECLHDLELIHRDVSPDNLMLTRMPDGSPRVKLIDLGIAKSLGGDDRLTATGMFLGKARYGSPEHFSTVAGQTPMDQRSDLYSFGVLLYELLTGSVPHAGSSVGELARAHLFQEPRGFAETDPEGRVPAGLRAVVLRALEKDPGRRHQTAAEFARRLAPFAAPAAVVERELGRTMEPALARRGERAPAAPANDSQERLDGVFSLGTMSPPTAPPESGAMAGRTEVAGGLGGLVERLGGRSEKAAGASVDPASSLAWLRRSPAQRAVALGLALAAAVGVVAVAWILARGSATAIAAPRVQAAQIEPSPAWLPGRASPEMGLTAASFERSPPPFPAASPAATAPAGALEQRLPAAPLPPAGEPPTYRKELNVIPPILVELPRPAIPEGARQHSDAVEVTVTVLVDETGKVLTAAAQGGGRRYRAAAEELARSARFRPASKDGIAGRMWTEIPVVFASEPPSGRS